LCHRETAPYASDGDGPEAEAGFCGIASHQCPFLGFTRIEPGTTSATNAGLEPFDQTQRASRTAPSRAIEYLDADIGIRFQPKNLDNTRPGITPRVRDSDSTQAGIAP
jgi:hypothetical protein